MAPVTSSASAEPFLPTMSSEATLRLRSCARGRAAQGGPRRLSATGARGSRWRASTARGGPPRSARAWPPACGLGHLPGCGPWVDPALVADMTRLAREFFALPPADKLRFDMSGGKKGGFIVSSHLQARDYSGLLARWPDKPAAWRAVGGAVQRAADGAAWPAGCWACSLERWAWTHGRARRGLRGHGHNQKVVVTELLPQVPPARLTLGLKRHTDPGTITLLLQDLVGGLQATRDGGDTWITVQPVEGAFVVNLGDHGHYLSNGRFKNADHQAVVNSECSRLSIATFQNPAPDATVYPLAVRDGEDGPSWTEPITFAGEYRRKMWRGHRARQAQEDCQGRQAAAECCQQAGVRGAQG
ncbi:hypothetical protein PR202_ga18707 [Eleusine coracana subsp. coracana]|uniref:Fe2OG dioxygenase domain-containing protein n=1 Tax=Eleusine coracana subsp. coracana TaxID=191504 RepID=A0AAV5CTV2_ELECO|nr:hypothetical protein PR202_ga18707 [Eleusine coracana subsp. coracana]